MHRTRLIKGTGTEERIVDLYILMILCIYPLYISNYWADGMIMKYVLFIVITFMCASVIVFKNIKRNLAVSKQTGSADYFVMGLLAVTALFRAAGGLETFAQATELAAIAAYGLGYFVVAEYGRMRLEYLHFFLCFAAVVCIGLVPGFVMKIVNIGNFSEEGGLIEYFLLVLTIAVPMYLHENKKQRKLFYFIMCIMMISLLLLSNEAGAFLMLPFIFVICMITFKARLSVYKRLFQLLLAFIIILKLFILFTKNSGLDMLITGFSYQMANHVWVDLLLVIAGILYVLFMDKLVNYRNGKSDVSYPKVRFTAMKFLKLSLFVIVIGVMASDKILMDRVSFGSHWYASLMQFSSQYLRKCYGTYVQLIEKGGIAGLIFMILLQSAVIKTLIDRLNHNETNRILLTIFMAFLFQNFLFPLQSVTTPIYMVLIALALGSNRENARETAKEDGGA